MKAARLRVFGLFLLLAAATRAGEAELPKGRILEKVACVADNTKSYALYVPTAFDPGRKWPVLFCFDPGARGKVPVERFQVAAERFGWFVAGSNDSRNGPWEDNAAAINAMVSDVNRHLPIDAKRIYVAGLSGGARVACQVAMSGVAKGVIACGAGFMGGETPAKVPFAFFGTAGVTDFNYLELRRVDRELADRRAVYRVVFHPGGHEWLSSELAVDALAWFELQAMRGGTRERDAAWMQAQFDARHAVAATAPAGERFAALRSLAADFRGLTDTTAVDRAVAELAASREVRDWQKAGRAAERREEALRESLMSAVGDGISGAVRKTVAELRAKSADPTSPERPMATRVLQGVASSCGEGARETMRLQDYAQAADFLELATLLRPERPQAWYDLARTRAHLRDRKAALAALRQAIAAGFADAERVRTEKAFDAMRNDPAFVELWR